MITSVLLVYLAMAIAISFVAIQEDRMQKTQTEPVVIARVSDPKYTNTQKNKVPIRVKVPFFLKIVILAGVTAILTLLAQSAVATGEIAIGAFLVIAILALNITYLTKISIPLKFFVPGILFFIAFVIAPIVFTVLMLQSNKF